MGGVELKLLLLVVVGYSEQNQHQHKDLDYSGEQVLKQILVVVHSVVCKDQALMRKQPADLERLSEILKQQVTLEHRNHYLAELLQANHQQEDSLDSQRLQTLLNQHSLVEEALEIRPTSKIQRQVHHLALPLGFLVKVPLNLIKNPRQMTQSKVVCLGELHQSLQKHLEHSKANRRILSQNLVGVHLASALVAKQHS